MQTIYSSLGLGIPLNRLRPIVMGLDQIKFITVLVLRVLAAGLGTTDWF